MKKLGFSFNFNYSKMLVFTSKEFYLLKSFKINPKFDITSFIFRLFP